MPASTGIKGFLEYPDGWTVDMLNLQAIRVP